MKSISKELKKFLDSVPKEPKTIAEIWERLEGYQKEYLLTAWNAEGSEKTIHMGMLPFCPYRESERELETFIIMHYRNEHGHRGLARNLLSKMTRYRLTGEWA